MYIYMNILTYSFFGVAESDLQHWATYTGGVYLFLLMQLLENKAIIGLTQSDFVEAQKVWS